MTSIAPPIAPTEEPKATTQHTLCGYGWSDVINSLLRAIGAADMPRALRWSAELVCSEMGLGRLEAALFHAWALHASTTLPTWPRQWYNAIQQIRGFWTKSGGDTKSVRNTPIVRQLVAEATATLVLAAKKPLPALPTSADCFREAEAMRERLRVGGGVGDQLSTRRVWLSGQDGTDLKTIGNELEAAIRGGQTARMLFWVVWFLTLEKQTDAPPCKERGPASVSAKARKSLAWFFVALFQEMANEGVFLSVEERKGIFGCLETTWGKLGERGRRDALAAIACALQEHLTRRGTPSISGPLAPPPFDAVRAATATIDEIYSGIAAEARRYLLEVPRMAGLTADAERAARAARTGAASGGGSAAPLSSRDRMALVYSLATPTAFAGGGTRR